MPNYNVQVTQACVDNDSKRDTNSNQVLHVCAKITATPAIQVNFHAQFYHNNTLVKRSHPLGVTNRHEEVTRESIPLYLPSEYTYDMLHNNPNVSLIIKVAGNEIFNQDFTNINLMDGDPPTPCSET